MQQPHGPELLHGLRSVGNVTARRDLVTGLDETFTYDELNRMRAATLAANGTALEKANQGKIVSYHYDTVGRLAFRSDLGRFFYDGAQPHAVVTRVVGDVNATFTYDASGNMRTGHGRNPRGQASTSPSASSRRPKAPSASGPTAPVTSDSATSNRTAR
ncbi:MAG: hypothetical protein IPG50_33380 [Myxococcales bacterium]|nr:hypothetical protein [Myxococcales bacterium]